MLSDAEKANLADLLVQLELVDLLDLAKTSTGGLLTLESKEDAVKAILQHSDSLLSILMRKRVTKSYLFQYLHEKGVEFSTGIDKPSLIDKVIKFWDQSPPPANSSGTVQNLPSLDNPSVLESISTQFSKWFFGKLNEFILRNGDLEVLEESDFWSDSKAVVKIVESQNWQEHEASGALEVLNMIQRLQSEFRLIFLPNLNSAGTKAKADVHGLVVVMTCGTLHKEAGEVVGVFEQMFLLARDPHRNENWKVQKTELTLRSEQGITSQPQLPSNVFAINQ